MDQNLTGNFSAASFSGNGANITNINRNNIALGTPNHVLVNTAGGVMSSLSTLNPSQGGTGQNTSASTGIARVTAGTWSVASNISNADISAAAAIDRTKIANGTANHVVINSGTGALTSEAQLATSRGGTGLNLSVITGPAVLGISGGAIDPTIGYTENAVPKTLMFRDGSTNSALNQLTANTITATGNLTITPAGQYILFGGKIHRFVPTTLPGGGYDVIVANLQTSSNTVTPLLTYATTTNTTYTVNVQLSYAQLGGVNRTGSTTLMFKAKNFGGSMTVGSPTGATTSNDGGITAVFSTGSSGTSFQFRVQGGFGALTNWMGKFEVTYQTYS